MFHYLQNFSPDDQHFDDFFHSQSQKSNSCLISSISDYDLGSEEVDIFKAPEPITEQSLITLSGEDIILQEKKFTYLESLEDENFMSNLLREYEDILEKETSSSSELPQSKLADNSIIVTENSHPLGKLTKSLSSDSFISVDAAQMRPSIANLTEMESMVHGMRRVCSEEYIKPQFMSDQIQETRMQKLSRYRDKKAKRNFGRKIKYAFRKALADGQPRIKGRFAKTE